MALDFTQLMGVGLNSLPRLWTCHNTHSETGCRAVAWFYSWSSHFNKGFVSHPSEGCLRPLLLFMNSRRVSAGPVSWLSGAKSLLGFSLSSECFYHDCPDGAWMNRTRMITRLRLASAPFIPPMWPLMIFRAAHYMLPAFPRMSCKSRGTPPFELLRPTQVNIVASRMLNIS